ncbi:DUF6236 family protein [Maricaulis sp.]|uniref:DUF6236 family protein n=1 Tax=Maricaulis sp. TaxID=1486257 RepID=UPI003A91B339
MYIRGDGPLLAEIPTGLLYWDRLLTPIAVRGQLPAYDQAVEQLIALEAADSFTIREENSYSRNDIPVFIDRALQEFAEYNRRPEQAWSFLLGPGELTPNDSGTHRAAKIELELWRRLPIPDREVPYQDIIEFRTRRRAELLALHDVMETISATYARDPNESADVTKAFERADRAIDDLENAYSESWKIKLTRALSTAALFDAAVPAGLLVAAGTEPTVSLAVGSGYAALRATISSFQIEPAVRDEAKAFKYVVDARAL